MLSYSHIVTCFPPSLEVILFGLACICCALPAHSLSCTTPTLSISLGMAVKQASVAADVAEAVYARFARSDFTGTVLANSTLLKDC
jgi:hypothetical protein